MTLKVTRRGAVLSLALYLLAAQRPAASETEPGSAERLAPWFVQEPPSLLAYAAAAGAWLPCAARGSPSPAVAWLLDGHPLPPDRRRRVHSNGTLEIAPAPPGAAGATGATGAAGGEGELRCRASNEHGVALSAPVTLLPVADDDWQAEVTAAPAAAGGVAVLACGAGAAGAADGDDGGELEVALWYHEDRVIDVPPPSPEARYLSAGSVLLIRRVSARDAGAYGCLARHRATRRTRRARPARLHVSESFAGAAPGPAAARTLRAAPGAPACMPCAASPHPAPHYTWYREHAGRLVPAAGAGAWEWAGGAALCVARAAPGAWLCKAASARGDATARLRLVTDQPLTVTLQPSLVVAASGSTVRFNCSCSEGDAALSWRHDGAALAGATGTLELRGVSRAARGVYQCEARRGRRAAQASAELRLGESAPELQYTFIEQALRPGGDAALRCAAAGAPPPRIAWLLDDQPLAHYRAPHRYTVSEEAGAGGGVVSALRLRALAAADGGRYTCRAHNARGHAEHSARLNVYGPPSIRAAGPVRVVAGANATIYCPYAGYPISAVWWWRGAERVPGAGRVAARGAALRMRPALPPDAGAYACSAAAPAGETARRDIQIQVLNPPQISPFMFSAELREGSSAQALCGVWAGDKPLYFSWLKDGAPLPAALQVQEKSLGDFSLLVFPALAARHAGRYTCRVANAAASADYSATLSVKVAPSWTTEPADAAVLLGAPLLLECAARGHPTPVVTWYRRVGDSPSDLESDERWEEVGGGEWGSAAGGALSAAAAARRHQGRYRCRADNGVGAPLLKHFNVTVHEPAHFEDAEPRNVSAVSGREAVLRCRARGDAPLSLTWTRLGRRLDLDSFRWTVTESGGGAGAALRSELRLRAAERADAGEYRCVAANHYGRAETPLFLHVEEPPAAPTGLRLGGVGARWARLVWEPAAGATRYSAALAPLHAPPDAAPRAANLTLERGGEGAAAARLAGLRPGATYSLRAVAANHVGSSPPSAPLVFTTLEEAPSSAPLDVRVRAAAPDELLVTWTAPPRESWNGELLGYAVTWRALSGFDEEEASAGETGGAGEEGADPRRAGAAVAAGWARAELRVRELLRAARYAVTLRAYNRAGAGPPAPAAYGSTAPGGEPAEAPSGVRCTAEAAALRVWWSSPAAPAPPAAYDVHYAPLYDTPAWRGPAGGGVAAGSAAGAALRGLRAATNYSVWVRARGGPASRPAVCTTLDDAPGAVSELRALPAGAGAARVSWRAPERPPRPTHYTLYTKERDKAGGEWSQRVEASMGEQPDDEAWHDVRGLRERVVYEFWVRAHSAAGAGPSGRVAAAAPSRDAPVRISSWARTVTATRGSRLRLGCAAAGGGAGALRRRWSPLPRRHALTAAGDLLIHDLDEEAVGNYTCTVSASDGSSDAAVWSVTLRAPPPAPAAPRLRSAGRHRLLLAWDAPARGPRDDPLLGFTVWWARDDGAGPGAARSLRVAAGAAGAAGAGYAAALAGLACGARHRVWLRAHSAAGAGPPSRALAAATTGRQAAAPPASAFIWANSTALRLNLLVWRAGAAGGEPPCPVARWSVALRPAPGAGWAALPEDGESAEGGGLAPGAWYELRVAAHSAAGSVRARYRAATRTAHGERIGEPISLPAEESTSPAGAAGAADAAGAAGAWRGGLAPALAGGALLALLAAAGWRLRARRSAPPALPAQPQLYSTEPGKKQQKILTPPHGDLDEISPYATFSMGGACAGAGAGACAGAGAGAGGGCALHLHTFGRASPAAPGLTPARPNLLHNAPELCRGCESDSDSSGSPCAACADHYRAPLGPRAPRAPRAPLTPRDPRDPRTRTPAAAPPAARARRRQQPPAASHRF